MQPSPLSGSRKFLSPPKETPYPLTRHSLFPLPPAPGNTSLLSVFMNLLTLHIAYKWNHYHIVLQLPMGVSIFQSRLINHFLTHRLAQCFACRRYGKMLIEIKTFFLLNLYQICTHIFSSKSKDVPILF